jgi:tetratricopeptide (TPR) repeat protein
MPKTPSLLDFLNFGRILSALLALAGCRFSPDGIAHPHPREAGMKLFIALMATAALATTAQAGPQLRQVIYNVDAVGKCSAAANNQMDLKDGLAACTIALRDPAMNHRAALLLDRGVIEVRLGDTDAALQDYSSAIALDGTMGDAYVSRAGVLVEMKRYDEARADIAQAITLGASNLHAAYYSRGVIEEETGDAASAYRDYKQALAIRPDFAPAIRELSRFKMVRGRARA